MKIFCVYSKILPEAKKLYQKLVEQYNFVNNIEQADIVICLGGDGFMLHCLHEFIDNNKALYGINCGTYGFLLNEQQGNNLLGNIQNTIAYTIHPLVAHFKLYKENEYKSIFGFNEISFFRGKPIASHLNIRVGNYQKIEKLIGDGIMVSSAIGSTAYNRSCGGSIISTNDNLICLTPINTSSLRHWSGATVDDNSIIEIENIDPLERPIHMSADFNELCHVEKATVSLLKTKKITLLFDKNNDLESKIIKQKFGQ